MAGYELNCEFTLPAITGRWRFLSKADVQDQRLISCGPFAATRLDFIAKRSPLTTTP
jgi:hypothetical protein